MDAIVSKGLQAAVREVDVARICHESELDCPVKRYDRVFIIRLACSLSNTF